MRAKSKSELEAAAIAIVKQRPASVTAVVEKLTERADRDDALEAVRRLVDWNKLRINNQWLLESP